MVQVRRPRASGGTGDRAPRRRRVPAAGRTAARRRAAGWVAAPSPRTEATCGSTTSYRWLAGAGNRRWNDAVARASSGASRQRRADPLAQRQRRSADPQRVELDRAPARGIRYRRRPQPSRSARARAPCVSSPSDGSTGCRTAPSRWYRAPRPAADEFGREGVAGRRPCRSTRRNQRGVGVVLDVPGVGGVREHAVDSVAAYPRAVPASSARPVAKKSPRTRSRCPRSAPNHGAPTADCGRGAR
jgi:hypothetical protein